MNSAEKIFTRALTALLVEATYAQRGLVEISDFAKQVFSLAEQSNRRFERETYSPELTKELYHSVVDLYNETFLDPYDIA